MLNAPVPAVRNASAQCGMALSDIDLFEVNEAFAGVPLKFMPDLQIDPARVNVNGGAMALGHPIGATGAIIPSTLLDELERRDLNIGWQPCASSAAWHRPPSSNAFNRKPRGFNHGHPETSKYTAEEPRAVFY
jgi:acetyl-CoA acetyltransferase